MNLRRKDQGVIEGEAPPIAVQTGQKIDLKNKIVCVTGVLTTCTREHIIVKLHNMGAIVGSIVTSRTNYLIVGRNGEGTAKYKSAIKHKTKLLKERDIL
jgi:NAD-dependent DNA ligase